MNLFHKFTAAALFSAMFSLTACDAMFHDDLADCEQGVYVNFYSKTSCDKDSSYLGKVSQLHVLAFDQNNKLAAIKQEKEVNLSKDYKVLMPVKNGQFSFIAWTGLDNNNFSTANLVVGQTTKQDLMFQLNQQADGKYNDLGEHQLFNGQSKNDVVLEDPAKVGELFKTTDINLLEKTYRINVSVKVDKETLKEWEKDAKKPRKADINDFVLRITSGNAKVNVDGTTVLNQEVYEYPARLLESTAEGYKVQYTLPNLVSGANTTISLVDTKARDKDNNIVPETLWSKDLMATALLGSGLVRNPNVNLDCDHDLDIEFFVKDKCKDCYTYVCGSILVEAWQVHSYSIQLGN